MAAGLVIGLVFMLLRNFATLVERCRGAARTAVPTEDPDDGEDRRSSAAVTTSFPLVLRRCHELAQTNLEKALVVAAEAEMITRGRKRGKKKSRRSAKDAVQEVDSEVCEL